MDSIVDDFNVVVYQDFDQSLTDASNCIGETKNWSKSLVYHLKVQKIYTLIVSIHRLW